ncbi:DinB family protein [Amaricoccus sp.]|uniref:DinB family protein n=1 Tax=Amaricoccus sp. TaxID=1872485 RepID=UPI001B743C3B|nr:DinB family protein [Amaricoccus sp.]MBP7241484.1 damage-inducible protein DinB [Amaricoccus sp.]
MGKALIRHFREMARNNAWANDRLLSACCVLSSVDFAATRTSFFPSIRETLNHNLLVDLYYLDALEQGGAGRAIWQNRRDLGTARGLRTAQARADRRLIAFCDALEPERLAVRVDVDRGHPVPERIDALLAHLFQHQIHHRGQAHAMLAGTAARPPQLDEFFLDYDRDPGALALGLWPVPE